MFNRTVRIDEKSGETVARKDSDEGESLLPPHCPHAGRMAAYKTVLTDHISGIDILMETICIV